MLKALAWLDTHGDGIQALGTALAYLLAVGSVTKAALRWRASRRNLEVYIDHLSGPAWSVQIRYTPPSRHRLYAWMDYDRSRVGVDVPKQPSQIWLEGVTGVLPTPKRELHQPHHVPLPVLTSGSPAVGCGFLVVSTDARIWRVKLEIRDHDSDRRLISRTIAPSKKIWTNAGTANAASKTVN